jgi:hypothetical protein
MNLRNTVKSFSASNKTVGEIKKLDSKIQLAWRRTGIEGMNV